MTTKWSEPETWSLITQIKLSENFKVLYGQASNENSSGDTKHTVHQRIAAALWNGTGEGVDMGKLASRVKNRISWLEKTFKEKVKLLKKTGEGVEEWYQILPSGPDHDTEPRAVSIWDRIVLDFKFFPDLYRVWSTKPNLVPVCATTGIGPNGGEFILIQRPGNVSKEPVSPKAATPPPPPLGLSHSNSFTSLTSSTPPSTPSQDTKENVQPPPSSQRAPRSSAFSSISFTGNTGDKKPVPAPPKVGFEDKMIGLQREMLQSADKRAGDVQTLKRLREERKIEDQRLKRRKLLHDAQTQLLNEYKSDIWTVEEYRVERKKLDELYGSPKKANHRAPSPDWDEDRLNADVEGDVL
ncbi:hypothetical protein C8R42DRAFT_706743 [Lentinula raphanica]|nr:hypothetical protein C8R42DRAFT_706743 [Lentinula raphanica]